MSSAALIRELEGRLLEVGDPQRAPGAKAYLKSELEFFIRKSIGWVLRDVARKRPERTRAFLEGHLADLSGLTLREACRHLPARIRDDLLRRHRLRF